jgi:ATPase subunit of ABC transporter with duplicated ATPase domains
MSRLIVRNTTVYNCRRVATLLFAVFLVRQYHPYLFFLCDYLNLFNSDLDKECIEALGEALDTWGGKDGAILVISHDRSFCEKVGFTHVATVADGTLKIEQRSLCDDDWEQYSLKSDASPMNDEQIKESNAQQLEEEKREIAKRRKLSVNAPRRIAQLEKLISGCEVLINSIDAEAFAHGNDVGKLVELTKAKEREQAKVDEMMKEWEELEAIIAEFS